MKKVRMSREDIILNIESALQDLTFIRDEIDCTIRAIKHWKRMVEYWDKKPEGKGE